MLQLTDDELNQIRLRARLHSDRDGYCAAVDADGCRCLRRSHLPDQPHDFSYTPFDGSRDVVRRRRP